MELLDQIAVEMKKRARTQARIGMVFSALGALSGIGILFLGEQQTNDGYYVLGITAVLCLGVGLWMLVSAKDAGPEKSRLYRTLGNNPNDVRAIYVRQNIVNTIHVSSVLVFVLEGGHQEVVLIPPDETEDSFQAKAAALAPQAKLGFNPK